MNVDYFLISQLKVNELYNYINQKKKSLSQSKKHQSKTKEFLLILSQLNIEIFIFLLSFIFIGSLVNIFFGIMGTIISLVLILSYYRVLHKVKEFEKLIKNLHSTKVRVLKENKIIITSENDVEIGDTIFISTGERVPFDIRVIESNSLIVDESKVFGERKESGKSAVTLPKKEFKLYELSNIVFADSLVIKGTGKGIVINKKDSTESPMFTINYYIKPIYTISSIIISFIVSTITWYLYKDLWISIMLFSSLIFISSSINEKILNGYFKYLVAKDLLSQGILLPTINKLGEYKNIQKTFIKLDLHSYDLYTPLYFILRENKFYTTSDLILDKHIFEIEELKYCFIISKHIQAKTKDTFSKIFLNPIINSLSSLGYNETTKNCKIIDDHISNTIDGISTIKVRDDREVSLSIISLSSYVSKFGTIVRINEKSKGVVVLMKDLSIPNDPLKPIVVVIFQEKVSEINEINKAEDNIKFSFLTNLSIKEIYKFFESIGVEHSRFSSIDADEFLNTSQKQKEFILQKFQIIFNLSPKNTNKVIQLLSESNDIAIDSFIEISPSDIGIMKMPYFGTFFNKNNLILSTTESFLTPFILINKLENFSKVFKKLKNKSVILSGITFLITVLCYLYGIYWISTIIPIMLLLITLNLPNYSDIRKEQKL